MTDELDHAFAAYPMVGLPEATGRVAAVYADALGRLPFVPSLLKSLAVCPPYLVLAWQQAAPMLDRAELAAAARDIAGAARPEVEPLVVSTGAAATMRAFREPLARMLLLTGGLLAALHGDVEGAPAPLTAPTSRGAQADDAPSPFDTDTVDLYGAIRAAFVSPIVNTIWRRLAVDGELAANWPVLEQAAVATRAHAGRLQRSAYERAASLPWHPVASPQALELAGVADAAAGMSAILSAYLKTLPRVLTVVAAVG